MSKRGRKYVNTTVYFRPDQVESLERLSKATRVPAAAYVREGLDVVLARHSAVTAAPGSIESPPEQYVDEP